MKYRKKNIFYYIKIYHRSSNMDVHTCRCIWFIWLSGLNQDSKWIELLLEINLKNGFEVKEKKDKRELKNKKSFKSCKVYFWKLTKSSYPIFELKVYLKQYLNLNWIIFEIGFWNKKRKIEKKWKRKRRRKPSLLPLGPKACFYSSLPWPRSHAA